MRSASVYAKQMRVQGSEERRAKARRAKGEGAKSEGRRSEEQSAKGAHVSCAEKNKLPSGTHAAGHVVAGEQCAEWAARMPELSA